jgi:hypothetical protein
VDAGTAALGQTGVETKELPGGFSDRAAAKRMRMIEQGGGNALSEAAVARALKWIALHQAADGHWSLNGFHALAQDKLGEGAKRFACNCDGRGGTSNDIAATAFGLLPFLAAGETHKPPEGRVPAGVHYQKEAERGLKYLISQQKEDGDWTGGMYAHALATIALCEAYGMTCDPTLKGPAQKAIDYIVKAQHREGGWRYGPGQPGDTSVTGWQVQALKAGQFAGLKVPETTFKGAEKFLDSVMSADGGYGYMGPQATPWLTASGLWCRQFMGWSPRNPNMEKGVVFLKKVPPGTFDTMYYYYYATQVMRHLGGDDWNTWNKKMRDLLIATQDKGDTPGKAHQFGSWDPKKDAHGSVGGRLMITSLSALTLEVYYRHALLYRDQKEKQE